MNHTQTTYDTLREKAMQIDLTLQKHYGAPFNYFSVKDPLSEMVSAMLSHRTKNRVSGMAYRNLRAQFPSWEEVRDAEPEAVIEAIKVVTYPEVKGPRIQEAIRIIERETDGSLSLDFLKEMPIEEARAWVEKIPGIGAKTSAAILNFSLLRLPALVVDMHHLRVAQRTGIIPPKCGIDKGARILQGYLPKDWTGHQVYDSHQGFMRHGQKCCYWKNPDCENCVVKDLCNYYKDQFNN